MLWCVETWETCTAIDFKFCLLSTHTVQDIKIKDTGLAIRHTTQHAWVSHAAACLYMPIFVHTTRPMHADTQLYHDNDTATSWHQQMCPQSTTRHHCIIVPTHFWHPASNMQSPAHGSKKRWNPPAGIMPNHRHLQVPEETALNPDQMPRTDDTGAAGVPAHSQLPAHESVTERKTRYLSDSRHALCIHPHFKYLVKCIAPGSDVSPPWRRHCWCSHPQSTAAHESITERKIRYLSYRPHALHIYPQFQCLVKCIEPWSDASHSSWCWRCWCSQPNSTAVTWINYRMQDHVNALHPTCIVRWPPLQAVLWAWVLVQRLLIHISTEYMSC